MQVIDHGRKQHAVFTGLANARHAGQRVLQTLFDHLFGFPDALAPQVGGIAQLGHVIVDVQVNRLGRLAFEDDHVPARHLELGTPVAARIGAGNGTGQRAFGNDGVAATSRGHGTGQRAGGPDDLVLCRQWINFGINFFNQVLGTQATRADVGLRPFHIERFRLDGTRGQVNAEDFSCP
ncbi:MAG: hypothetical protein ACD_23C00668G0001 [uncultured bacterium]|nr:MAG: hypothetical protein ACD_23C00668G0001 [uncultured bacterium]